MENNMPSIWQVLQYVEFDPPKQTEVSHIVIATSAKEAAEIVGEDERSMTPHSIRKVADVSQLPGDKYTIVHKEEE